MQPVTEEAFSWRHSDGGCGNDALELLAGAASEKHRRKYMEDRHTVTCSLAATEPRALLAVFDGHSVNGGGDYMAEFVATFLAPVLERQPAYDAERCMTDDAWKTVLCNSFLEIDKWLYKVPAHRDAGTTALVCVVLPDRVITAWAGDSRAVLVRTSSADEGVAVTLSKDHKPSDPDEHRRITKAGGRVNHGGQVTVPNGKVQLAVARSLGDFYLKKQADVSPTEQPVVALPDVRVQSRDPKADYALVLASDGYWDVVDNEETARFVVARTKEDPKPCATVLAGELVEKATENERSGDNTTVVVAFLNKPANRIPNSRRRYIRDTPTPSPDRMLVDLLQEDNRKLRRAASSLPRPPPAVVWRTRATTPSADEWQRYKEINERFLLTDIWSNDDNDDFIDT